MKIFGTVLILSVIINGNMGWCGSSRYNHQTTEDTTTEKTVRTFLGQIQLKDKRYATDLDNNINTNVQEENSEEIGDTYVPINLGSYLCIRNCIAPFSCSIRKISEELHCLKTC